MKKKVLISLSIIILLILLICLWLYVGKKEEQSKDKDKEFNKPIGNVYPKDIWGRVEEISGDGIVNVRVVKSETEAKENDIIQIKYDNAYLMEVNTSVDLANGNLVVATIYDDNELEKAGEMYKLNIESLWRCYEGCVACGYIEKINDDDTIDVVVEYVYEYDVAEIHNMHEFDNKKVNVKYEVFETNWSSDGWVSGTGTPMEGLEVMVLFQKDAIIESESGVAIECERIFEIKPDDYLQTVS